MQIDKKESVKINLLPGIATLSFKLEASKFFNSSCKWCLHLSPKLSGFTIGEQFIWQVMFTEYVEEKKELIRALAKDRKLSDLPKIPQVYISSFSFKFGRNYLLHTF